MIWNTSELSKLHLSRVTAIFVVDCWRFGISWMFGLKTELMVCAHLVGGTMEQSRLFNDLIWEYQWYETLMNCLHHTLAVPQPLLLLITANLALAGCLGRITDVMWYYHLYKTLLNCLHYNPAVPQPFLFLISANFALAGFLGWTGAYGLWWLGWR